MRKSSGTISQDPTFNSVTLRRLRATGVNTIQVTSDIEVLKPNTLSVSQLRIIQNTPSVVETRALNFNENTSFVIDIDEQNPNTLVIRKMENETVVDTGVLYDTQFNKPDGGAVLFVSPTFSLPAEFNDFNSYLLENPSKVLLIEPTAPTSITLPTFKTTGEDDFKQIRISNLSFFPVTLMYNEEHIVEMFHERISVVWCQKGGNYTWNYVP